MDVKSVLSRLFNLNTEAPTAADATDSIEVVGDEMTGVTGFLSYRQRLKIKRGDSTISVFVKFSDRTRSDLGEWKDFSDRLCPRECLFYGTVAPLLHRTASQFHLGCISLPTVHHELVLPTGSLLVMEDLGEAGFQLAPPRMSAADARCIVGCLARLQAAFWLTKAKLGASSDGLLGPASPIADSMSALADAGINLDDSLVKGYDIFRENFPKVLKCQRRVGIIEAYMDDGFLDKARKALKDNKEEKEAIGLNHLDLWFNNCMIRRDGSGKPVDGRIIDWQLFGIGGLGFDFGLLWVASLDNSIVVEEFMPSVEFYHESIRCAFESAMQQQFPVSLERTKSQAIQSVHWHIAQLVMFVEEMLAFGTAENVLSNMADLIEHLKL